MKKMMTATLLTLGLGFGSAQAQTTLHYWSMWNQAEPQGKVLTDTIKDFEAANPGVKVQVNWLGRNIRKLVLPALDSKSEIDVFDNGTDWLSTQDKYLLPLDTYLRKPSADDAKKTVAQTLNQALLNQYKPGGKTYAVPYQPFAVLFFYNKDHFTKAGIKSEPKTWPEFLADNEALKKAGFGPITTDIDAYLDVLFGYFAERYAGNCTTLQRTLADKTGNLWVSTPDYLKMAQNVADLNAKGYLTKATAGNRYPAGQQQVALGDTTMELNGTWLPGEVKDTSGPDFKWGSFSFPTVPGGKGNINTLMMGSQGLGIPKASKNPDLAFKFITAITAKKTQQAMVAAGSTSARTDVPWVAPLNEAGTAVAGAQKAIGWACDLANGGEVVTNVVMPALTDLFVGKLTPQAFVTRLQSGSADFYKTRK